MPTRPNEDERTLDEAAGWIARLRADDVDTVKLRAFSAWLGASQANRAAFDRMLELWRDLGVLGKLRLCIPETPGAPRR